MTIYHSQAIRHTPAADAALAAGGLDKAKPRKRTGHHGAPRKVDANQAAIVAELRQAGCSVTDLHTVGAGCPDILVSRVDGFNWLFEIKSPGGKLTDDERTWHIEWKGQVAIIYSAEDALRIMGVLR